MTYWPGTKIRKSTGNAFDWRGSVSVVANDKSIKASNIARMQMAGAGADKRKNFTIYSRAKAAK